MEKCHLCKEELELNSINKLNGTLIKIKKDGKNEPVYICPTCQKKHKNKLKEEISNS